MDLLSLLTSAAIITDADLIDAPPSSKGDLRAYFDFDADAIGGEPELFQHRTREHFITDLDVEQHLVIENVKKKILAGFRYNDENRATDAADRKTVKRKRRRPPCVHLS